MLQRYLGEIGIELVGEDHRHRGVDASTFRSRDSKSFWSEFGRQV